MQAEVSKKLRLLETLQSIIRYYLALFPVIDPTVAPDNAANPVGLIIPVTYPEVLSISPSYFIETGKGEYFGFA